MHISPTVYMTIKRALPKHKAVGIPHLAIHSILELQFAVLDTTPDQLREPILRHRLHRMIAYLIIMIVPLFYKAFENLRERIAPISFNLPIRRYILIDITNLFHQTPLFNFLLLKPATTIIGSIVTKESARGTIK